MTKTLPFSMRLDAELKEKLAALAVDDGRSLTNYIERVLTTHVEHADKSKKDRKKER